MTSKILNYITQNNIKEINNLLINNKLTNQMILNRALDYSAQLGHLEIVKVLLNYKNSNPCHNENLTIHMAYKHKRHEIVILLFSIDNVRITLKNDNYDLYKKLINQETENKVSNF